MPVSGFHRDRPTLSAYVSLGAFVWALYGLGPALLIIRDETGMTRAIASLHSTATAIGTLMIGVFGPWLLSRLGRSRAIRTGTLAISVGVLLIAFSGSPLASIPGALLLGAGGSIVVTGFNSFLSEHHGAYGPSAIGEAAGVSILAGALSPIALGAFVSWGLPWQLVFVVAIVGIIIGDSMRGDGSALDVGFTKTERLHGRLPSLYWWAWISVTLCIGVEFSFVMWAGDVLRDQSGASLSVAAASLTAVAGGMAVSRFLIPVLLKRYNVESLFRASLVLPLVMWVPMWISTSAPLILASMIAIGFGLGLHYPLSVARMVTASGGRPDLANSRSALASGTAISVAPLALGVLADAAGLHLAFTAVPVILLLAIIATVTHPVHAAGRSSRV